MPLTLPPLRERREDILPLAEPLPGPRARAQGDRARARFAREAADALRGYHWPGNVRELRSVVERAALYATGETVASAAAARRTSSSSRRRSGRAASGGPP